MAEAIAKAEAEGVLEEMADAWRQEGYDPGEEFELQGGMEGRSTGETTTRENVYARRARTEKNSRGKRPMTPSQ